MGPKQKKAPTKKKITKAERLRLLQEEEEKRLKEEEEARLKYEKEEQERLEKQRIEREKWNLLEKKDLERRSEELEELALLECCFPEAEKQKREMRVLAQWKHYTECDGSPDPRIAQEMNTFISLWEEEKNETFEQVMEKSKLVLSLIEKLKLILLETPSCDLDKSTVLQYQGSILRLQELLSLKVNVATELLLRQASNLADLDTGNMEKIIKDENVTLYVWANLKKNPRYRTVKFSQTQVGFEIPRILATSNVALRLLHTHYDHITPLFSTVVTEEKHGSIVAENFKEEERTEKAVPEENVFTEEAADEAEQLKAEEERELSSIPEEEVKFDPTVDTVTQKISDPEEEESQTTQFELERKLLSETVSAAQLSLIENVLEMPETLEPYEVNMCHFAPLGGVYHLEILELPPQSKPVKGWVLAEIRQEGLQKFTYPPENTEEPDPESAFPPIEVTLEIHESAIFFEDPQVVRWDAEGKFWRSDGVTCVYYNRENRLLTFSIDTMGPVTLIQDAHVNMPYQSWELSPLGMNKALLMVTTVFIELQIHIKVPQMELKAYRQMALLSSAFSFGWSKWNMVCNSTRVVFRVREHISEEEEQNTWALLMFSGDRAQMLKMQEESDQFSETLREGSEFHSTLYHMMKDFASPEATEKVRHSNCQFIDSVCYMLLSVRVLSYS
uniref:Dynein axonemal intermediate chain 7 n=1 Tax=Rattus norvegicus TaxID=10116 RepID=F7FKY0_RAT